MVYFCDLSQIELGEASQTGHTVYKKAVYKELGFRPKKVIYKKNKNNNAEFSVFEVAFSSLVSHFLSPNLTPEQILVKNENQQIDGLVSEHFCYAAARNEGLTTFYSIEQEDANAAFRLTPLEAKEAEDIPVYFFDQVGSGFFTTLWDLRKRGNIDFDMSSLASVLTSSYTLEEDDLHKGNLGFYIVKRNNRQVVVFFKIDNDFMLADSVMSRYGSRFLSWTLTHHAFDITARDLKAFPKLFDSANHYWPTSQRYIINPVDNRVYSGPYYGEINAFVELGRSKAFQAAKWREFYKHILIPPAVIGESLIKAFDQNDSYDRANLALIMNAVIARQAKLRAVLFTIPEFRSFVRKFSGKAEDVDGLQQEILRDYRDDNGLSRQGLRAEMRRYHAFCNSRQHGFSSGDTPLHVAIKLGDYRYHETWEAFSQFAEVENQYGEKPLDLAIKLAKLAEPYTHQDPREDPYFIIKSLLNSGVEQTNAYRSLESKAKKFISNYKGRSDYLFQAGDIEDIDQFLQLMQDLGEDHRYSLKLKKEISIACMKQFIHFQCQNPHYEILLRLMKIALNGNSENKPAPELQFIRQLRSKLWIVRIIRGLLGGTATQDALNELIEKELFRFTPPRSCFSSFCSFFANTEAEEDELADLEQPELLRN